MKDSLQADRADLLRGTLAAFGAAGGEADELLHYNENRFALDPAAAGVRLPLADQAFVPAWEGYAAAAAGSDGADRGAGTGVHAVLAGVLPQLRFPIRRGISLTRDYQQATRHGAPCAELAAATGLDLERPDRIELRIHASLAGRIPLLICRHRPDFVALVQALAKRNEPEPVPDAQGAAMIAGYVNWDRVQALRRRWEAEDPAARATATWSAELARLDAHRDLYQDRFILLSDGPYSGVPAADLGLAEDAWRERSLTLRREHECAHYFTRRLFGAMSNNVLDELIADYAGITAVAGRFRADWFLRFVGLEAFPRYRTGARLDIYRGKPPLSPGAFGVLQALVHAAAHQLERWDAARRRLAAAPDDLALALCALAALRLEDLAATTAGADLDQAAARALPLIELSA